MTTPTDTRCLTCGHDKSVHGPVTGVCAKCRDVHMNDRMPKEDAHHPFVPAPSTTDAVADARARVFAEAPQWENVDEALDAFEAAIVSREHRAHQAMRDDWDVLNEEYIVEKSRADKAEARIEAYEAAVKALREIDAYYSAYRLPPAAHFNARIGAVLAALDKQVQP